MSRVAMFSCCLALTMFALGLSGCPGGGESTPPTTGGGDAHAGHEHAAAEHAEGESAEGESAEREHGMEMAEGAEMPAGLAELSEEDRAAATKQKVCPVSGEPLGSMGTPVKVTVKDREVFLCCAGCKGAITEDPDKYLAKLDE